MLFQANVNLKSKQVRPIAGWPSGKCITSAHNKIGTTECPTSSRYSTESQDSCKREQVYMSSGSLLVRYSGSMYIVMNATSICTWIDYAT